MTEQARGLEDGQEPVPDERVRNLSQAHTFLPLPLIISISEDYGLCVYRNTRDYVADALRYDPQLTHAAVKNVRLLWCGCFAFVLILL